MCDKHCGTCEFYIPARQRCEVCSGCRSASLHNRTTRGPHAARHPCRFRCGGPQPYRHVLEWVPIDPRGRVWRALRGAVVIAHAWSHGPREIGAERYGYGKRTIGDTMADAVRALGELR